MSSSCWRTAFTVTPVLYEHYLEYVLFLLEHGEVERFNSLRSQTPFLRLELPGISLEGLDLKGADFQGAILDSAEFRDASLSGASFVLAALRGADFSRARFQNPGVGRRRHHREGA